MFKYFQKIILVFLLCFSTPLLASETLVKSSVEKGKGIVEIKFPKEVKMTQLLIGDRLILSFSQELNFYTSRILEEMHDFLDDLVLQKSGKVLIFDLKESPKVHPDVKQINNIIRIKLSPEKISAKQAAASKNTPPKPLARDAFEVSISSHLNYDRVEINWDNQLVKYNTDMNKRVFKVTFNQSAKLDPYRIEQLKSKLVPEVKILNLSPFTIAFKMSDDFEVVPRKYDEKLYIDVIKNAVPEELAADDDVIVLKNKTLSEEGFEVFEEEELVISPPENAALIAFKRGKHFYLGFDRMFKEPLSFLKGRPELIAQFKVLPSEEITMFSAPIKNELDVQILREETSWKLKFLKKSERPTTPIPIKHDPAFPMGGRILIENMEASKMFWFTDPYVKDKLKLIPLSNPGEYIGEDHHFVQFHLLETMQGIVIKELDEALATKFISDGIEITHPEELYISTQKDLEYVHSNSDITPEAEVIFDFVTWRQGDRAQFKKIEESFFQALSHTDPAEKNDIRFDFARFYLSHGLAQESLGILNFLQSELPGIEERKTYKLVYGLASYLARRPKDASVEFDHQMFDEVDEVKLFRALLDEDVNKNRDVLVDYAYFVETYPYPLQHHVAMDLVSKLIKLQEFDRAKLVLSGLGGGDEASKRAVAPGVAYYKGVILQSEGDMAGARASFEQLVNYKDRYYRALSKLSLVVMDLDEEKTTVPDAIEELENLQFVWRGDYFERDVIIELINTYLRDKDYRHALLNMKKVVTLFPEHPGTLEITAEMNELYSSIFLTDKINEMSAIEAYSLYKSFVELNPIDTKGNQVVENLAEKLVDIDVLDKAQEMYDYQLEYRLEGYDKARIGARLAGLYLLDNQAKEALSALDKSIVEKLNDRELRETRQLLRASALVRLDDLVAAKDLLKHLKTQGATMLAIDIAWKEEKWVQASQLLEKIITHQDASQDNALVDDYVIKLATALSLADDQLALERLREVFGGYMKKSSNQKVFDVLTLPEKYQENLDMTYIQDQIKDVEIFDQFLEDYKKN